MKSRIVLDTGPLVALLNKRDNHHTWARTCFAEVEPPLLTCEAVISEACFLVRALSKGPQAVIDHLQHGVISIPFCIEEEAKQLAKLLARYASVPMSLADACLVRMAEQQPQALVMTLDNDFRIYRKNGRQVVPTLMPPSAGGQP
jgi:predicted nucleic acid-binding protein